MERAVIARVTRKRRERDHGVSPMTDQRSSGTPDSAAASRVGNVGSVSRRTLLAGSGAGLALAGLAALRSDRPGFAQLAQGPATPNPIGSPVPPEVQQYAGDWPVPQGDLANTRANLTTSINSSNVKQLEVAWRFPIKASGTYGGFTANPIIAGDMVYIQDMQSNVFALDRKSGKVVWETDFNTPTGGPNGVTLGYGMVYGSTGDTRQVFALDARTGQEIWRATLSGNPAEGIDMAPQVYGSIVYISTVPGNSQEFYRGGTKGIVFALDAKTGIILWSFDTTTDNLWGDAIVNNGGGLWYPPAIDADGNIYFDVANPGPWPGYVSNGTPYPNGASRPGPNDYTDCLVALSPTGQLRWFYRANPHDIFDHDLQQSPVLASIDVNGTRTPVVLASGKLGKVIAVEASTGQMIWTTKVGQHNQWDDAQSVPAGETVTVLPGALGGVETPIAYAGGTVFVSVVNLGMKFNSTSFDLSGALNLADATGNLTALNVADGSVKWDVTYPTMIVGGATVANDVVFTSGLDGVFRGHATDTGELLWSYQATTGFNAPPAIGSDLIVVGAAGPLIPPQSGANPAATPGGAAGAQPASTPATSSPEVLAFRVKS